MASILRRTYTVVTADGRKLVKKCKHYTIEYTHPVTGKRMRQKGYTDLAATKQRAARLEKAVAWGNEGLTNPFAAHLARKTLEHLADYLSDLSAAGRDEKYVDNADKRMRVLIEECGWPTLGHIEPNSFIRWREQAKTSPRKGAAKGQEEASATTLNQYLETARGFCNWCARNGRMPGVPHGNRMLSTALSGVCKVEGPKVRKRRALSDEEVAGLLQAAPTERRLPYRLALASGLRRDELDKLKWGDCRVNATKPYLALRSEATKARRGDRIPLPLTLAEDLRTAKPAEASDNDPVFPDGVPPIELWKEDLTKAQIPYKDAMGRQADFHGGTRKTLCTRMHRNGVAPALAMRIMRHTDIRLTMVDYTDDEQLGTDAAVLPEVKVVAEAATSAVTNAS
jgi:integrase